MYVHGKIKPFFMPFFFFFFAAFTKDLRVFIFTREAQHQSSTPSSSAMTRALHFFCSCLKKESLCK